MNAMMIEVERAVGRLWNGIHFRHGEAGEASGRKLNQGHGFQAEGRVCVKSHDAVKELSIEQYGRRVMGN